MTDKKLTDEEIIKRLEQCVKRGNLNYDTDIVLDLINRQKAEIERLKECPKCVYEYDGEMTEYCVQGPCSKFKTVEQIKAEAYREFAERLKKKISAYKRKCRDALDDESVFAVDKVRQKVDNLLKEMESENNA